MLRCTALRYATPVVLFLLLTHFLFLLPLFPFCPLLNHSVVFIIVTHPPPHHHSPYHTSTPPLDIARKLLISGISNFPHSKNIAWFHTSLGHLSRQQGDITTSRACYQRALKASPPQKSLPILVSWWD
jgi:hypothetical protein